MVSYSFTGLVTCFFFVLCLLRGCCSSAYIECSCPVPLNITCGLDCQQQQRQELLQLFQAWHGAGWAQKAGWGTHQPHCEWTGVNCCSNNAMQLDLCCCNTGGGVGALQLAKNNITGDLAALLAATSLASTLQYINLEHNSLRGSITDAISVFQQLAKLQLAHNQLDGTLPGHSFLNLTRLHTLSMPNNSLTGVVPVSLVQDMQKLQFITLDHNQLEGTVPLAMLLAPRLKRFSAGSNRFTGSLVLPDLSLMGEEQGEGGTNSFGHWHVELNDLDLEYNAITGTIPPELTMLDLTRLDLTGNHLTGSLPPLGTGVLNVVRLGSNDLSGEVPDQVGGWDLLELDVSNNRLEGTLPQTLEGSAMLTVLKFNGNRGIYGTLPEELAKLQHLAILDGRNTSMQQPKYVAPSDDKATAVPPWMGLVRISQDFHGQPPLLTESSMPVCPFPVVKDSVTTALVMLDPFYFQYEGCECMAGMHVVIKEENGAVLSMICQLEPPLEPVDLYRLMVDALVPTVVVLGVCLALVLGFYIWLRMGSRWAADMLWARKQRAQPPQSGQPVTLVLTDVAGSTELWEWDNQQAAEAVNLHDKILRRHLSDFCGYEVTTEGDAFLVAFHDPADAVAYCLTVQLALQDAEWNQELLDWALQHLPSPSQQQCQQQQQQRIQHSLPVDNSLAATVAAEDVQILQSDALAAPGCPGTFLSQQLPGNQQQLECRAEGVLSYLLPAEQLFCGLRVRMAVASGVAESVKQHKVTHRVEYGGAVMLRVQAIAEAPEGGQVLLDSEAFKGISSNLPQLGERVLAALEAHTSKHQQPKMHTVERARQAGQDESLEHAIGATTALAAATAAHYDASESARASISSPELGVGYFGSEIKVARHLQNEWPLCSGSVRLYADCDGSASVRPSCDAGAAGNGRCLMHKSSMQHRGDGQLFITNSGLSNTVAAAAAADASRPDSPELLSNCLDAQALLLPAAALELSRTGSTSQGAAQLSFTSMLAASGASFGPAGPAAGAAPAAAAAAVRPESPGGDSWLASEHCNPVSSPGAKARQQSPLGTATSNASHLRSEPGIDSGDARGVGFWHSPAQQQHQQQRRRQQVQTSQRRSMSGSELTGELSTEPLNWLSAVACADDGSSCELSYLQQQAVGLQQQQQQEQQHGVCMEPAPVLLMADDEESDDAAESCGEALQLTMIGGKSRKRLTGSSGGWAPATASDWQQWQQEQRQQQQDEQDAQQVELAASVHASVLLPKGYACIPGLSAADRSSSAPESAMQAATTTARLAALQGFGSQSTISAASRALVSRISRESHTSGWSGKLLSSFGSLVSRSSDGGYFSTGSWRQQQQQQQGTTDRPQCQAIKQVTSTAVMVLDMGLHKLQGISQAVQLVTVLPPGLEARAHYYPPISTLQQHTPGYLDAPAAAASPLHIDLPQRQQLQCHPGCAGAMSVVRSICPLPPVVMVFCTVDRYQQMLTANRNAAEEMLQQYSDVVRWTLLVAGGYECQEQEGNYMIAFQSPGTALEWALLVQEALMEVNWSSQVLALPGAGEVMAPHLDNTFMFRGPRVRVGLYRGLPTRVTPHSSTGRADYFGPLVNRAARYCHSAAHGGQVVAPRELVEELISQWCGVSPTHLPDDSGPPWALMAQPQHDDDEQATACWARMPPIARSSSIPGRGSDGGPRSVASTAGSVHGGSYGGDVPCSPSAARCLRRSSSSGVATVQRRVSCPLPDLAELSVPAGPVGLRQPSSNSCSTAAPNTPSAATAAAAAAAGGMGGPGVPPVSRLGSNSSIAGSGTLITRSLTLRKVSVNTSVGCSSPAAVVHPVPDMSALLALRKVAAEQQQQVCSSSGGSSNAAAAGSGGSQGAVAGGAGLQSRAPGGAAGRGNRKLSNSVHGHGRKMSGGWDIDCGLAAALYARLVLHKWKWADTALVHDLGEFAFKGISGSHSLVSVTTKALAGRHFPHHLRKGKGEQLTKGCGLLYELHMQMPAMPGVFGNSGCGVQQQQGSQTMSPTSAAMGTSTACGQPATAAAAAGTAVPAKASVAAVAAALESNADGEIGAALFEPNAAGKVHVGGLAATDACCCSVLASAKQAAALEPPAPASEQACSWQEAPVSAAAAAAPAAVAAVAHAKRSSAALHVGFATAGLASVIGAVGGEHRFGAGVDCTCHRGACACSSRAGARLEPHSEPLLEPSRAGARLEPHSEPLLEPPSPTKQLDS